MDINPFHIMNQLNNAIGRDTAGVLEFLHITDPAVKPDGVREVARKWQALAHAVDDADYDVRQALQGVDWQGKAADALAHRAQAVHKRADDIASALHKGSAAINKFADVAEHLIEQIGVIAAQMIEFEVAGLAMSVITAGFSEAASTIMSGERAMKIVSLVQKIEEEGGVLADAIKAVSEAIRSVRAVLAALKDIKGMATVTKLARDGAAFTAFATALQDPGAYRDPGKLAEVLGQGALLGVGFGVAGKAIGKGLRELSPAALKILGNDLSRDSSETAAAGMPGEAIPAGLGEGGTEAAGSGATSDLNFKALTPEEQARIAELEISKGTVPFGSDAEAAQYGSETWNKYAENLPQEQRQALYDYSMEPPHNGPTYKEINGFLRGNESAGTPDVLSDIDHMDKALGGNRVPHDIMVVRGTDLGHIQMPAPAMIGKAFPEDAYVSTSLGKNPVSSFSGKDAVMHWRVPAGTPAIYMEKVSAFGGGERELLLGRGIRYRVDRVVRLANQWHIYGEVLPG